MPGYRSAPLPPNWKRLRARVLRRDAGICHVCKNPGADAVDHVVPAFKGGTDDESNLAPIHDRVPPHCHRTKTAHEANPARRRPASDHPGVLI